MVIFNYCLRDGSSSIVLTFLGDYVKNKGKVKFFNTLLTSPLIKNKKNSVHFCYLISYFKSNYWFIFLLAVGS